MNESFPQRLTCVYLLKYELDEALVHPMTAVRHMRIDVGAQLVGEQLQQRRAEYADRTGRDPDAIVVLAEQRHRIVKVDGIALLVFVGICAGGVQAEWPY